MFVFAEESSDGIVRVKIVPDDGSLYSAPSAEYAYRHAGI